MLQICKRVVLFYCLLLLGCTGKSSGHTIVDLSPPTKSFVKVIKTISITSCGDKQKCTIGEYSSTGSGMSIDILKNKNTVLTAGHVCSTRVNTDIVKDYTEVIYVMDHQSNIHPSYVVKYSHDENGSGPDLCVLWVPSLQIPKVKISKKEPKVGQELYYIGAPAGVYHPPVAPIFKGIFSGNISNTAAMITVPAAGGSSGSAVLNKKNEIVGVVFAVNPHFHHISLMTNYYSTIIFITQALKDLNSTSLGK